MLVDLLKMRALVIYPFGILSQHFRPKYYIRIISLYLANENNLANGQDLSIIFPKLNLVYFPWHTHLWISANPQYDRSDISKKRITTHNLKLPWRILPPYTLRETPNANIFNIFMESNSHALKGSIL